MRKILVCVSTAMLLSASWLAAQTPKPKRVNKAIELLEQGQPIYYTNSTGGYEEGKKLAQTPADYIDYGLEHGAFDMTKLREFMRGLVEGGPTKSGHRTPAVIVTLPIYATDVQSMRANSWMIHQVLAAGVHGILMCNANDPEAIRTFVEATRYPFAPNASGLDAKEGMTRGNGSQGFAAQIWGLAAGDYMRKADPWPLNAEGEILLGLKIENRHALANAEISTKIPGIGFAEWGPGDMGWSLLGLPEGPGGRAPTGNVIRTGGGGGGGGGGAATGAAAGGGPGAGGGGGGNADRVNHPSMRAARSKVLAATKAAGIAFLNSCNEENVIDMIKEGVMICTGGAGPGATKGREFTKRPQPW
jgi:4-hydroxy-2-oxoheptanedioate aldolase